MPSKPLPRLCISALSGGGGKTLLSLGLCRAFAQAGYTVQPFKKGPDYIDAAWLTLAAGRHAGNLDPFFLTADRLVQLFVRSMNRAGTQRTTAPGKAQGPAAAGPGAGLLGIIEGNRGLFDGLDVEGSCATAAVARALRCPIVLSVDCTKMTRTTAALLQGLTRFEEGLSFGGVVLNQLGSGRHESLVRRCVEAYTDLKVLGALPRFRENPLPERHMGISSEGDALGADAEARLDGLAEAVRQHVDLDTVLRLARTAPELPQAPSSAAEVAGGLSTAPSLALAADSAGGAESAGSCHPVRIGYVRDAAFWFYYEENLQALRDAGAELIQLSALEPGDLHRWSGLDGLYLGGGFPEDFVAELSQSAVLPLLARLAGQGLPVYAECGGLMLLAQGLEVDGKNWPMSGFLPVQGQFTGHPQGLGYVQATVRAENPYFPQGLALRGHEFHFSRCVWQGEAPVCALQLDKGTGMGRVCRTGNGDAFVRQRVWAGYTHIFAPAVPCWAGNMVAAARRYRAEQEAAGHHRDGTAPACQGKEPV